LSETRAAGHPEFILQFEIMSASTTVMTSSTSVNTTRVFWERLCQTPGIQSVGCFIIAYVIYGSQLRVGAPTVAPAIARGS
jgi:hypothetical protein